MLCVQSTERVIDNSNYLRNVQSNLTARDKALNLPNVGLKELLVVLDVIWITKGKNEC